MKNLHLPWLYLGDQVTHFNVNDFVYFTARANVLVKLIFAVSKSQSFKAFAKRNSTNFLTGKTFDDFVIFHKL